MARRLNRLTAKAVEQVKRAGMWPDGGGLYLQVSSTRSKSWIYRFTLRGKSREMGLGSLETFSLAEARDRAQAARKLVADGADPILARRAARAQAAIVEADAQAKLITFEKCATAYIAAHKAKWTNKKHASQWTNTIATYCGAFNDLSVQAVDTALVMKALEPIWTTKPETATRLRARIEAVLDWATVSGYRAGDNPARWRGHLAKLLPGANKRARVKHHAAIHYDQVGKFLVDLRKEEGTAARALELVVLTAARTGEVIGAIPEEFDLDRALWIIPAERMKGGREHRVPLSPTAVTIVRAQLKEKGEYVFPGAMAKKPMSNMAMLMALKRMKRTDVTVHGFRSSFRDWGAEQTAYPNEVLEMALAHTVGDKVEAAYRRGDMFEKRRRLMLEWERYCEITADTTTVVPMKKAAGGRKA
jgi:integrase